MRRAIAVLFWTFMVLGVALTLSGTPTAAQEKATPSEFQDMQQVLDIALVLDNSGSMRQNDPQFLTKEIVTNFVVGFGPKSRLAMILFNQDAKLVEPLTDVSGLVARANFLKSLDQVDYTGLLSDSPAAIERAIYELKLNGRVNARKVIILLTDGIVDTGDKARDLVKAKWLKESLAQECQNAGIKIFGIAFTDSADFSLIQTLAFKTKGEYFRAYTAEDIQQVFNKIDELIKKLPYDSAMAAASSDAIPPVSSPQGASVPQEAPTATPQKAPPTAELVGVAPKMPEKLLKPSALMFIVLIGGFVLLAVIVTIMVLSKGAKASPGVVAGRFRKARPKPARPRAELIDVKNITNNKTLKLNSNLVRIGRDASNDVAIPEETVSSFHAAIEYQDGFFYLEDQRSKNKTYLNGEVVEPYSPTKLKSGDVITINVYKFIFILPDLIPTGETVIDLSGQAAKRPLETTVIRSQSARPESVLALPQALMIDVKNITGKKTLLLNKDTIQIGRGVHNDIDIAQNSISGSHAVIHYKDGSFFLEDQRSKNKTFLNGEEITPHTLMKLKSGDEILFDIYKFIFLLEQQTPSGDTNENW